MSNQPDPFGSYGSVALIEAQLQEDSSVERAGFAPLSSPSEDDVLALGERRVEILLADLPPGKRRDHLVRLVELAASELAFERSHAVDFGIDR